MVASGAALSPCTSPSKAARLTSCPSSPLSPVRLPLPGSTGRKQLQTAAKRRICVSTSALAAPDAASSNVSPGQHLAGTALHPRAPSPSAFLTSKQLGPNPNRFSSCICRNAPAGNPLGPTSSGGAGGSADGGDESNPAFQQSGPFSRAMSPVSTAQHALGTYDSSSSSSVGGTQGLAPQQGGPSLDGVTEPSEVQLLNPAAAAAVALPGVTGSPAGSISAGLAATAAVAAAAEAAVAGALDAQTGHAFGAVETAPVGPSAAGELQDLFTMLKFQVASDMPPAQLASTLVPIVRCAATNQLSLPFITAGGRDTLLLQLMAAEDPAVSVLATEAWCRVCGETDLEIWSEALLPAVPILLSIIGSNAAPEARKVPLLFFAMSSLVRMASLPAVARAVQQQGGLPKLVQALHVVPAAICQVTTFALFRLMRELDGDMTDEQLASWQAPQQQQQQQDGIRTAGDDAQQQQQEQQQVEELALMSFVRAGAFSKLCKVLAQVEEGSAHELAFSMLLSLALIPAAQQLVADQGEIQQLVQVMTAPPSRVVRLEAMLVLGRLAARNRACQQDAVREGVVPVLVEMMMDGSDEERCHSCRLLAILGQHETTHQIIMDWGAVPVMMQLLRNHGSVAPSATFTPQHVTAQRANPEPWHEAAPETLSNHAGDSATTDGHALKPANSSPASGDSSSSSSSSSGSNDISGGTSSSGSSGSSDGRGEAMHSKYRTSGPFRASTRSSAQHGTAQHGTAAGATAGAAGGKAVGPELVLEQAAGLACMLCHNADNHFVLVNQGVVPLLVGLLQQGVAQKTVTYTMASLLMLCMGDTRNAAVVARAGAIPALVSIAREGNHRAANRELAAALLAVMCRSQAAQVDVVASGGIPALTRLLAEGTASACCSAAEALTQIATTSDVRCRLVVRAGALPHLKAMLQPNSSPVSVLWASRLLKALTQERNTLWEVCETPGLLALLPNVLNRRPGADDMEQRILQFRAAASSAAAAAASGVRSSDSEAAVQQQQDEQERQLVKVDDSGLPADAEEEALEKAQAHVAWLLAALASDPRTRAIMAELASFLVRPLVVMLRDAQNASGPGYTLQDVLHGMSNNRQAAASAALRALGQHVRIAGLIQSEIGLQHWMGHNVQLPKAVGEWPPPTPGWFMNVDWWSPGGPNSEGGSGSGSWM